MENLLYIMALTLFCFLFWQQRKQSELAKTAISKRCEQLDLQLLSVSFSSHRIRTPEGNFKWHSAYNFEFTALGDDKYQANLIMRGFRPVRFNIPPYRMDDTLH